MKWTEAGRVATKLKKIVLESGAILKRGEICSDEVDFN